MKIFKKNKNILIVEVMIVLSIFLFVLFILYNKDYLNSEKNFIKDVLKITEVKKLSFHYFVCDCGECTEKEVDVKGSEEFVREYLKNYREYNTDYDGNVANKPYFVVNGYEMFAVDENIAYWCNEENEIELYQLDYGVDNFKVILLK